MTVQELIDELENHDPDALVVLQKDAEGNGYSPLVGADECSYLPSTPYSGEVPHRDDLKGGLYGPEDLGKMVVAVVLWPRN